MAANRTFGWIRDSKDARDHSYASVNKLSLQLPKSVDLRSVFPPVYDQGNLGSCTGQAVAGVLAAMHNVEKIHQLDPSRLFIYYGEREIEGTIPSDDGAQIRDGIKVVASNGCCSEATWPYVESNFADKPPAAAYAEAAKHIAIQYQRVGQSLMELKSALFNWHPIAFGIEVFPSFMSRTVERNGVVPMPSSREQSEGGHAIVLAGYDDATQRFLVRNSWGPTWGIKGYCYMPYNYVTSSLLASDFWSIQKTS